MKSVGQHIYEHVDAQQGCELIARNGMIIRAPDEDWLEAAFTWIDREDAILSVSFYSEFKSFVKKLGIGHLQDLEAITPGRLMELYNEGLAEIVCFVSLNFSYCMSFRKQGDIIMAENERGKKHIIPVVEKMQTPDEFINYARRYYELMECNEN